MLTMLENSDDLTSVVVLEAGSAWPAWLSDYQRLAPNAVVIAQDVAESSESFQARALHRIAEVATGRVGRVRVGVLVAADVPGQERSLLRRAVAGALLRAMGSAHEAELVLAGDSEELDDSRHEMFALAGTLCEELGGTRVSVHVRFSNTKSGVMRAVAPSGADFDAVASEG